MKVLAFVGTRADLFPLGPVLSALAADDAVELHVATAIGFPEGTAFTRLLEAGLPDGGFTHHEEGLYLEELTAETQARTGAELSARMAGLAGNLAPDAVVVLGDRWELLYVLPPFIISGIRLVHLHGGEVTEGALDERVRHAVTKLADQHCVSTAQAARRVAQLGESADRIHQTGAPGLDRFADPVPLDAAAFEAEFGVPLELPLVMVTYHPPTAEMQGNAGDLARQVFEESIRQAGTAILTYPGFDAGREDIIAVLKDLESQGLPGVVIRESLGPLYPRVMATVQALVGNSSSGILEAATFGVPVVNVGDRQRGREHGANVIHCRDDRQEIRASIEKALTAEFRAMSRDVINPYGNSHAAGLIEKVVVESPATGLSKTFVDVTAGELNL
ncbi:UDP-N-acetylglucosamine 2-epimerase [Arthrobacter cupressi]|uniref:UDP-N-acetylglucosamine 2-epimerase (Non-hydrolysing) n=1 Tax=Arthrobacter cupressi TaxID=1045773 RepID=A0A1G8NZT6_9MICC|nr:UDP-N-acetylglucosamine 2-epimerase [Arthrobacter cupressi]NYD76675.1 UDP-N-acetylglucosamine 2-epimerase (non-hydrolyzing) [Arthrobacter cupressi]SDI85526.1 UDP-N-acetylglucosamine 2-epimerase (non-hydrolysing) [Arthrobacter cupressi]